MSEDHEQTEPMASRRGIGRDTMRMARVVREVMGGTVPEKSKDELVEEQRTMRLAIRLGFVVLVLIVLVVALYLGVDIEQLKSWLPLVSG